MDNTGPDRSQTVIDGLRSLLADLRGGAERVVRGGLRGLSDSGHGTAAGVARLAGRGDVADRILESRDDAREFYGGSDGAALAGRVVGDLGQFAAPGTALGRLAGAVPRVGQAVNASRGTRVASQLAADVPVDAAIGASEREASLAGLLADLRGPEGSVREALGESETLDRIADSPVARAGLEAVAGAGLGGAMLAAGEGLNAARSAREAGRVEVSQRSALPDAEFARDLPDVRFRQEGEEEVTQVLAGVQPQLGGPRVRRTEPQGGEGIFNRLRGLVPADNRGALGVPTPELRNAYDVGGEIPFYSRVEKAIQTAPFERGSPQQWRARLEKAPEGTPKGEREWTGIDEWLDQQSGTLSREQVLEAARENGIRLSERVRGRFRAEPRYGDFRVPGEGENYREIIVQAPDAESYRSGHWEEPNPLVHMRVEDRVIDGDRTLFVHEIQSDWHQAGRERGYKSSEASLGVPDAPLKGTGEWVGLAWRRILKDAVEGGYDRVAFASGEQSAALYDLRKQVGRLEYDDQRGVLRVFDHDGELVDEHSATWDELPGVIGKEPSQKLREQSAEVRAIDHDPDMQDQYIGIEAEWGRGDTPEAAMDDARSWVEMNAPPHARRSILDRLRTEYVGRTIEGDDLVVGGQGMLDFYNQIVPRQLQKEARNLGVRVELEPIAMNGREPTNLSLRITPEIAEAARTRGFRVNSADEVGGALAGGAAGAAADDDDETVAQRILAGAAGGGVAARRLKGRR